MTRAAGSRQPTASGTPTIPRHRTSSICFRCSDFRLADLAVTRNGAFCCNPAIDRQMNLADTQHATDPAPAAAT
jgi:hypothetical protein